MSHKATHRQQTPNPWLILILVSLPVFIGALDLTIISAVLPEVIIDLQIPLESGLDDTAWLVSGYLLAYTLSIAIMGRASDFIGRRRAFLISLIVFTLGSIWVATADGWIANSWYQLMRRFGQRPDPSVVALSSLVAGRIIQALGAGALVPISMALVGDLFPPARRARPLGLIGAIDTAGWVVGHLYGGVMVQFVDWRLLFWLNVPIGIITLGLLIWLLRDLPQIRTKGRFDFLGAMLFGIAIAGLSVGLGANTDVSIDTTFAEFSALPPHALPLVGIAIGALIAFLLVERNRTNPLINLTLFRNRNFSIGNGVSFIVGFALMIGLVIVPILLNIRADSLASLTEVALTAGLVMSALTIPMALAAVPGGWLSERYGYRAPTVIGLGLAASGLILAGLTWYEDVTHVTMALHMIITGIGLGLTLSPTSAAVLNAAPADQHGVAAAIDDMLRLLGMTLAASMLTTIALRRVSNLAVNAIGENIAMTQEAVNIYVTLTAQVLRELSLTGAVLCLGGLVLALYLNGGRANEMADVTHRQEPVA